MDILLCVLFSMRILCYTITAEIGTERRRARGSGYFAARTGAQHFKHAAAAGAFRLCGGRLRAGQPDGRAPHDWDVCTSARPGEIKAAFPGKCLSAPGIRHGTVTVLLEHTPYEVTTFRTDGAYSDHRRPDSVRFVRSVTDDLARRDFTVNAMAYSPAAGLIDPFGGAADLAAKRLRCVGEPARRFSEDVLRVLRMARFAATMGFSVEPQTAAAALAKCGALTEVAIERSRAEFCKMLCGRHVARVLRNYRALFEPLLPCLSHVSDAAWENAVSAIQAAPDDLTVRMGLLFCAVEPEQAAILCPDAKQRKLRRSLRCTPTRRCRRCLPSFGGGCTRWVRKCCGA